ncbi:DUF87 domain-containing protein [Elizabethkingia miricola]|uniref:VirB4 family type IV secretion system protein n=1 Tax=Elizabethkingia miricola TaxID=172045 RepID=UPI002019BE13|nr:DUF87 domain-containing protein [Elizabethkingia miricola]MCL1654924.1 DUF87 domain-containing protein [Elizabethkingia miricola]
MQNSEYGHNGNFVLGYRLTLPTKFSLGEEDFDELNSTWAKALRDLPDGCIFFKQDIFTEEQFNASDFPTETTLQKETKIYFDKREYINHVCNIFFVRTNESLLFNRLKNPFRPPQKAKFEEYDEKINSFIPAVNEFVMFLSNLKLQGNASFEIEPLSQDYMRNYYTYLFSGMNTDYSTEIKVEWSQLRIGNKYSAILRFPNETKFPETFYSSVKDSEKSKDGFNFYKNNGENFSFDLPFEHIYNQVAFIDKKDIHTNNLRKVNRTSRDWRRFDSEIADTFDKTNVLLKEIKDNGDQQRFIRGYNSLIIFGNTPEELERRVNMASERFKNFDIVAVRAYGDNLIAQYEYSYPLNASLFINDHVYLSTTDVFSSFILNTGRYKNDEQGVFYTSRLDNTPIKVDLWDAKKKYMTSRSGLIITKTGGGKSFNINHISSFALSNGYRNVIIDLGGSYAKLASLYPNDVAYISYNEGENLGINPFQLHADDQGATVEKLEELIDFIEVHYKRTEGVMTQPEKASLRKILDLYYKNFSTGHSLPHFVKSFVAERKAILDMLDIKKEFFNDDEFVLMMGEFIDNGNYAFLYNSEKGISYGTDLYDKKLVVFELDKIKGNHLLVSLMLKVINTTIKNVIWRDKATRGYVFLEEFAELLKWDGMLAQAEWLFQAIRKQEGAIFPVLQTINQLPKDKAASQAIIDNCEVLIVLAGANYEAIQERFNLPTHALYLMRSMKNQQGDPKNPHTEVFIKRGDHFFVVRLEVPKYVFWAYQTEGLLNTILMKIYDLKNCDMETAIYTMMQHEKFFKDWAVGKKNETVADSVITELVLSKIAV